jgi:hypothetical protein
MSTTEQIPNYMEQPYADESEWDFRHRQRNLAAYAVVGVARVLVDLWEHESLREGSVEHLRKAMAAYDAAQTKLDEAK